MKINVSSIFETTQIAKTRAFGEISSFFDYFSVFSSNIIRALNNNIGIKDNMDATYVSYTMKRQVGVSSSASDRANDLEITLKKEPISIAIAKVEFQGTTPNYIKNFRWKFTADKKVILAVDYEYVSSDEVKIYFIVHYS